MKIDRNVVTLVVLVLTVLYIYIVAMTTPTKFTDNPVLQRRASTTFAFENAFWR